MDLSSSPANITFRAEVRRFIDEALPNDVRAKLEIGRSLDKAEIVAWQRALNRRGGWATPSWPVEYGGPGWDPIQRHIFMDELHTAPAPEPVSFNVAMIGPVLIAFGSKEQKERFLPRAANLDDWWAQGFSEPEAGSDLASLRTRAAKVEDHYVVNGQKLWQGMAHWADWMFTLVRTDPDAPKKQAGISLLLVNLKSPGITIRPVITIDGRHEVNEVFLDNVKVPVENRVGEENQGWTYAKFLLSNERSNIARIGMTRRLVARAKRWADARPPSERLDILCQAAGLEAQLKALEITQLRVLFAQSARAADPRSSILKIKGVELRQAASELLLKAAGQAALEFCPETDGRAPNEIAATYFNLRAASIYGGANEVQKNIIASTLLGL